MLRFSESFNLFEIQFVLIWLHTANATSVHTSCKQCKFTTNRHRKIIICKIRIANDCECAHFSSPLWYECIRFSADVYLLTYRVFLLLSFAPFIFALYLSIVCCVNGFVNSLFFFGVFRFRILLCVNWLYQRCCEYRERKQYECVCVCLCLSSSLSLTVCALILFLKQKLSNNSNISVRNSMW